MSAPATTMRAMLLTALTLCLLAPGVRAYEIDKDNAVEKAWYAPWEAYDRVAETYNGPVRDAVQDAANDAWDTGNGTINSGYAAAMTEVETSYAAANGAISQGNGAIHDAGDLFNAVYLGTAQTVLGAYADAGVVAQATYDDVNGQTPCGQPYDGVIPKAIECIVFVIDAVPK